MSALAPNEWAIEMFLKPVWVGKKKSQKCKKILSNRPI